MYIHICTHSRQHTATQLTPPQLPAPHCNTLPNAATNLLPHPLRFIDKTLENYKIHCDKLQQATTHCNKLQHAATSCNMLQQVKTNCNTPATTPATLSRQRPRRLYTHCNTLQHTATNCNTLQLAATHLLPRTPRIFD